MSQTESKMPNLIRAVPLAVGLVSYTACGVVLSLGNDWVRWAVVILLAVAVAMLARPSKKLGRRLLECFWKGLLVSLLLVGISLAAAWIGDRQQFFDDGGPIAVFLIIEIFVGLPMVVLSMVFAGIASVGSRLAAKPASA